MKKTIFLSATAAVMILMASCGSNAQKQPAMSDAQFAALLMEIFYKLPESVMPESLKTENQRKTAELTIIDEPEYINLLSYNDYSGEANHENWHMAGYLTTDQKNMVLIIQFIGGFDEVGGIMFDKTLNYNIKTKKITELERPIETFTTDELFEDMGGRADIKKQAIAFFNREPEIFYRFDREGFSAHPNLSMFWYGSSEEIFDYYNEHYSEIYFENSKPACRIWNGSRFVKNQ